MSIDKENVYEIGQRLTVRIEKIVPRGLGLAFAPRLTIFVSLAAPGDLAVVELRSIKDRTAFADIVEILESGKDRVDAPCVYYGRCGGCDFQHLNYQAQLDAKKAIVNDCLTRIGGISDAEIEMIGSPADLHYRSRARWHADSDTNTIGYYARDSHEIVPIDQCLILTAELDELRRQLEKSIDWTEFWERRAEIDAAGVGDQASISSNVISSPPQIITAETASERFSYDASCFFQANQFILDQLIDAAIGNETGEFALDLFCGVGLFSLPLAKKFRRVLGVEENSKAIDFARSNSELNNVANSEFYSSRVGKFLFENRKLRPDLVLVDPPRAGMESNTLENIAEIAAERLIYVSCEPSILARDLKKLISYGYEIIKVTAVDIFPQTHHIETVVRLRRRPDAPNIRSSRDVSRFKRRRIGRR